MSNNEFIKTVELEIEKFLRSSTFVDGDIGGMQKSAELLCLAENAKRIRTIMVYDFGTSLEVAEEVLIKMAASAELIHVASLLHDDVIDMGVQRRGHPTANTVHGNTIAVLTGDLLYSQALEFLTNSSMAVFEDAIQVVKEMTIAASIEYNYRGNIEASIEDWTKIVSGKTARLFSWCTKAPALFKNAGEETISCFDESGKLLGLAFQLSDDIKDFFASASLGKNLYSDIRNQNTNYILIKAMEESKEIKERVRELWSKEESSDEEVRKIGEQILDSQSFALSLQKLEAWIAKSINLLKDNGFNSVGDATENLIGRIFHSLSPEIVNQFKKFSS